MKPSLLIFSLGLVFGLASGEDGTAQQTLREQLEARASQSQMPAETREKMMRHLDEVSDSGIYAKAKKVGDMAPDFTLKNHVGEEKSLAGFLERGPVVLTWYRGGW